MVLGATNCRVRRERLLAEILHPDRHSVTEVSLIVVETIDRDLRKGCTTREPGHLDLLLREI